MATRPVKFVAVCVLIAGASACSNDAVSKGSTDGGFADARVSLGGAGGGGSDVAGGGMSAGGTSYSGGQKATGGAAPQATGGTTGTPGLAGTLGAQCASRADCHSGFCADGVCCESSCSGLCTACGPDGKCSVTPDDDACHVVTCPGSTACTRYHDITSSRCVSFGTCADESACHPEFTSLGTLCSPTTVCDGAGNCSLLADGQVCTQDSQCGSRQCVAGKCGIAIRSCADLKMSASHAVVRSELLDGMWPRGNPPGQPILVGGTFTDLVDLCFDDKSAAPSFKTDSNAMFTIPDGASVGLHTVTAVSRSGAVAVLPVQTVAHQSAPVTFTVVNPSTSQPEGAAQQVFGIVAKVYSPIPVAGYEPITNGWQDRGSGSQIESWVLRGDGVSTLFGDAFLPAPGRPVAASMAGTFDAARNRVTATVKICPNTSYCTSDDKTVRLVGIFSCPKVRQNDGPDGSTTSCAAIDSMSTDQTILVFFPDAPDGGQILLTKNGPTI